jgi:DNA ligase-1
MKYNSLRLYSKDVRNNVKIWYGIVNEESNIVKTTIYTGILKGNIRTINTILKEGKNIGKANATSPFQQAVKELKAKVKLKRKKGYKTLEEVASDYEIAAFKNTELYELLDTRLSINKTDANDVLKPMKAVQFKSIKKLKFPYILQPKINGLRGTMQKAIPKGATMFDNEPRVMILAKEGDEYVLPHITKTNIFDSFNGVLDGELYVHNEILSDIRRRVPIIKNGKPTNNSLDSSYVAFYCFDLSIPDINQIERLDEKDGILQHHSFVYYGIDKKYHYDRGLTNTFIVNVKHHIVNTIEEIYEALEAALEFGFEGIILREFDAEYMFGGRRTNMIKLKKTLSGEFKIIDVILKKEDDTRTYVTFKCKNDTNDLTFEITPNGNEDDRQGWINKPEDVIGKMLNCTFYERTVTGLPFHIVKTYIRDNSDMDISDINIEI